jgi:glucose-1-phosphate thymidylyltransferase
VKVVIPLAGKGTRLLPLTKHTPKPLVRVAGRPVMDYVVDKLSGLDVEELIFITGHLKEQVEAYVRRNYRQPARFIEQKVQDGTAGAVNLARPHVDGPVLIIFVDTLFDADLTLINRSQADGIIWAKEVEDYQRFGVVVTDPSGHMTRIVEKPSEPISRKANIGLYYIRDWQALFDGIEWTMGQPQQKGEWFLTEAFQYMINHGRKIFTAEVGGWYDCGKVDALLETNLHLLTQGRARRPAAGKGVTIQDPVYVADGVRLERCSIGPNVAIDEGAVISGGSIRDAIVGSKARLIDCTVTRSVIGDGAELRGKTLDEMIATHDEIAKAP